MNLLLTPIRETKVWGSVTHVFANPHASISLLSVVAGYRCSIHLHLKRGNLFAVQRGALVVESVPLRWSGTLNSIEQFEESKETTVIRAGEVFSVPAKIWHRFRVLESGELVEVYWADRGAVQLQDILRLDVGGTDDLAALTAELQSKGIPYEPNNPR